MMIDHDEEIENNTSGEWIIYGVYVGENIAIIIDSETNEQFWLLLVDKVVHSVEESFEDQWGNSYVEGDIVLRGYWYERL